MSPVARLALSITGRLRFLHVTNSSWPGLLIFTQGFIVYQPYFGPVFQEISDRNDRKRLGTVKGLTTSRAEWGLGRTHELWLKGALKLSRQKPFNIHITRKAKAILAIMKQLKRLQSP